jgi:putative transposase
MLPRRLRRLKGFSYRGRHSYALVLSTFQRRPLFVNPDIVAAVRGEILLAAEQEGIAISAYCFMQDHLHLVVRGRSASANLITFVKRAKQASGYRYARATGQRLWHTGYFERVLRDEDEHRAAVRYVLENPVAAGFVASPDAYQYSGRLTE